jgi:DNA-binding SARP family transcriptional activator
MGDERRDGVLEATAAVAGPGESSHSLALLGTFEFRVHDVLIELPRAAERLVAFLALQLTSVSRHRVAAALWPDANEQHSLACLRSALWRVRAASRAVIHPCDARLGLTLDIAVDIATLSRQAHWLLDSSNNDLTAIEPDLFGPELLPGWDDDWVLFERERLRQLALRGLEALSRRHLAAGRVLDALEAAWRAISLEPLLEGAYGTLIDAHLAEGNVLAAVRCLRSFAAVLDREMGITPSPALVSRVNSAVESRRAAAFSILDL